MTKKIGDLWKDFFGSKQAVHVQWFGELVHRIADGIALVYAVSLKPIWACFVAIFSDEGLFHGWAQELHLPPVIEEMMKLSFGVALFVTAAGIIGWLFVFDRKPINPPVAPAAAAVRVAGWVKGLASRSKKKETVAVSRQRQSTESRGSRDGTTAALRS